MSTPKSDSSLPDSLRRTPARLDQKQAVFAGPAAAVLEALHGSLALAAAG